MKEKKYQEVKKQIPAVIKYLEEVKTVEDFFEKKGLNDEHLTIVFWNHLITLFERVDSNEQNVMEIEENDEISWEAKQLTNEFCDSISKKRTFNITDFEKYLLTIYFQQIITEKENVK